MTNSSSFFQKTTSPLKSILDQYKSIASSSPEKLRRLIPSDEIWRFFIDGNMQEHGRGLSAGSFFKKSAWYQFNSINYLSYTIDDYIKKVEKIDLSKSAYEIYYSKLASFLRHREWGIPEADFAKYTLNDLLEIDKGWTPFEINEKGYLQGMYNACKFMFDTSISLDLELITTLHKLSTTNVKDTLYDYDKENENKRGEFRNSDTGAFPLITSNCSLKGMANLLNKLQTDKNFNLHINLAGLGGILINQECINTIKENSDKISSTSNYSFLEKYCTGKRIDIFLEHLDNSLKELISAIAKSKVNSEFSDKAYNIIIKGDASFLFKSIQPKDTKKTLEDQVSTFLKQYTQSIEFVQACEQLHHFIDGNCRTFCMLLLNQLLMKNDFPPVILENPNKFDAYSKDELFLDILQGMKNTFELINKKKLFNVDSKTQTEYLKNNSYLNEKFYKYFEQCCAIEDLSRKEEKAEITVKKPIKS